MAKKVFTFIFPSSLIIIILSIGVITWLFSGFFRDYYLQMTKERLLTNTLSMEPAIANELMGPKDLPKLKRLVHKFAEQLSSRITVIAPTGTVIADSDKNPLLMENHRTPNRKEIISALKGNTGYALRHSSTMQKKTMYIAIPIKSADGSIIGILRTAFFLDTIDRFLEKTYTHIIGLALLVATIAILLSYIISKQISTPLEKLKERAADLANGNFSSKPSKSKILEIQELTNSMNIMSESLQKNINKITQQKNEFQLILSNMVEGIIAVDLDDKIITINSAAKKILNTTKPAAAADLGSNLVENSLFNFSKIKKDDKLEQTSFREVIQNSEIHNLMDEVLKNGKTITQEIELNGLTRKRVEVHCALLRDISGTAVGMLLVMDDITQLSALENMRTNFAANVSHELKTPLTAIKGAVETLMDGAIENKADADRFLNIIYKHSERLNALINDIMSLSKIEQTTLQEEEEIKICPITQILATAEDICLAKAEQRKVSVKISAPENLTVAGNPEMLEQAFVNLLDNAIKYSPENDTVYISASQAAGIISISVTDHGIGIPEKHIPRLFERFYRVDKGRSRQQGGTGLGLAIVKHIISSHNGTVEVRSTPGVETTFTVKLPYVIQESEE